MISAVIAENKAHANALIRWIGLDADEWIGLAYGDSVDHLLFKDVFLARPHEGVTEEHGDWFIEHVVPRISGETDTIPRGWRPQAEEPVEPPYVQKHLWA